MALLHITKGALCIVSDAALFIVSRLVLWYNHKIGLFVCQTHQSDFGINFVGKSVQIMHLVDIVEHHGADMVHIVVNTGFFATNQYFPHDLAICWLPAGQAFSLLRNWVFL